MTWPDTRRLYRSRLSSEPYLPSQMPAVYARARPPALCREYLGIQGRLATVQTSLKVVT